MGAATGGQVSGTHSRSAPGQARSCRDRQKSIIYGPLGSEYERGCAYEWLAHLLLFRGDGLVSWIGLLVVVQNIFTSLFNSHLFDFHAGWMYVLGVGVAGGMARKAGELRFGRFRSARTGHAIGLQTPSQAL
jgi:hypothetical protein